MNWYAHVTVAAIAETRGRFLLIEELSEGKAVYNQPAGHLEKNETLIDAVTREVLEETARKFKPESIVGVYLYPSTENDTTYLRVCFCGSVTKEHPGRSLDDEIIRTLWLKRDEIIEQQDKLRSPLVLRCIDDYLAGHRFPLEMISHIHDN